MVSLNSSRSAVILLSNATWSYFKLAEKERTASAARVIVERKLTALRYGDEWDFKPRQSSLDHATQVSAIRQIPQKIQRKNGDDGPLNRRINVTGERLELALRSSFVTGCWNVAANFCRLDGDCINQLCDANERRPMNRRFVRGPGRSGGLRLLRRRVLR